MLNQTVIVDIFNKNWYNTINLLYVFNKINLRRAVRLNNKRLGGKNEKAYWYSYKRRRLSRT